MDIQYKETIRPILDCFDRIRHHLVEAGVVIPRICSIGSQSSGKSSVLESITNIQLPRGEGTVTRCPIMIQLRNTKKNECARIKYEKEGEDAWINIKLEEIPQYISKYQNDLIEKEGNPVLSDKAIQLEIHRQNACDLTLYDLPGITHKDDETYEKIKNIIIKFLKYKETIALFIHSSNNDIDANECLSLIRQIDDKGKNDIFKRTIPVFTKPDDALKTNPGTLVKNLQIGKTLGFIYDPIMVLNRNQTQLEENVDIEVVRQQELEMFNNPLIKEYAKSGHGIKSLIELLVTIQKEKLLESVGKIKQTVKEKLEEYRNELDKFPKGCKNRKEFNKYLTKFCEDYEIKIKETLINVKSYLSEKNNKKKCLETRIREEFLEFKKKFTEQLYKYLTSEFYEKVELILEDSIRLKPQNFYGEECCGNIILEEIKYVFEDCTKLIDKINKMIEEEISEPFNKAFNSNQGFFRKVKDILNDLIENNKNECINFFNNIKTIECDRNFSINERYMDYVEKIQTQINKLMNMDLPNLKKGEENKEEKEEEEEKKEEDKKEEKLPEEKEELEKKEIEEKIEPKISENEMKKKKEDYFYFYTNLDRKKFQKFVIKLKSDKNENKIDNYIIKIMCSIFSYMKIFLDRFLDYFYNGMLYYLLKNFLDKRLTEHIKNEFFDMDEKTISNIMGGGIETRNKIEKIERKINDLKNAYDDLLNL